VIRHVVLMYATGDPSASLQDKLGWSGVVFGNTPSLDSAEMNPA
jgi:hypothetical protein